MNDNRELKTTFGFLGAAAGLAVLALLMGWASKPPSPEEFSDIGEPFYAEFEDAADATRLRLASWNNEQAKVDVFDVKFAPESGWTIPSHNDYPADGEEQLSKTASSIIGIERGGLMPGRKDSHARYGVVDPLDENATGTEGRGSRLTLWKGDQVLADYIIGKRVDGEGDVSSSGETMYYVRKAGDDGEERVYRARLDIDISTDFSNWIEPDLLQLGSVSDLRKLVVDRYQVDEQTGQIAEGDKSVVTRASATDNWKLEGLDEKTESLVTGTVSKMTTALDDLEIIGVRKKPAILTAQLKKQDVGRVTNIDVMQMQRDLESKGFFLDPSGVLISNEGDFTAGIDEGVVYTLRFGEVFSGSKASLEVGEGATVDSQDEANESEAEGEENNDDKGDNETLTGRYVFITVAFDETLLKSVGDAPVKPEPPATKDSDEKDADTEADSDDGAANDDADAKGSDVAAKEETDDDAAYKLALETYEFQLEEYERQKVLYDEKVEAGKKRVEELSNRFADWYYVISAETFDDLAVSRSDLVEPKEPAEVSTDEVSTDTESPAAPAMKGDEPSSQPAASSAADADATDDKVEPVMESLKGDKVQDAATEKAKASEAPKDDAKVEPVMESLKSKDESAAKPADPPKLPEVTPAATESGEKAAESAE